MSKAKMLAAKELIQEHKYKEARMILNTIDHPKAKEWLAKLDSISPEKNVPSSEPKFSGREGYIESPDASTYQLICPKCESQNTYLAATPQEWYDFTCPDCKKTFSSRIVRIRAKRSRKNKYSRDYSVRVYDLFDREHLIEFSTDPYKPDIELRAKDWAAFSYWNHKLIVVQNFTVGLYTKISRPGFSANPLLTCLAILLILLVVIVLILMNGT